MEPASLIFMFQNIPGLKFSKKGWFTFSPEGLLFGQKRQAFDARLVRGFTMIELLVAISVFSVVIAIVSGIFVYSLRTNRTAVALISANNDASLTLDQMARMIRKGAGSTFANETAYDQGGVIAYKCLKFQYKGNYITYRWNVANRTLEWSSRAMGYATCDSGVPDVFTSIVSENLRVEYANFRIDSGVGFKYRDYPKITILLRIGTKNTQISESRVPFNNLQTSVSPRSDFRD